MKSKKSMANEMVYLIAFSVLLIVFIMFQGKLKETYDRVVRKSDCKTSVKYNDLTHIKTLPGSDFINCPLQNITIKEKDREKIKEELANLYFDVCDEFKQGNANLFNDEKVYCVIRGHIKFKNKGMIINDFGNYLSNTEISGKKMTYSEFCSGYKTERADKALRLQDAEQLKGVSIDTSKEYAIIFVYAKGYDKINIVLSLLIGGSPGHILQYGGIIVGSLISWPYGIAASVVGTAINYFTNPNVKADHTSLFVIREWRADQLKELGCEYLPAEQKYI